MNNLTPFLTGNLGAALDKQYYKVGIIGDSNADGASVGITTCTEDTLYLWDGTMINQVIGQSVANNSPHLGSIWQAFANAHKILGGLPILLVNGAQGGSTVTNLSSYNWSTSGTLYSSFVSKVNGMYNKIGASSLDLIVMNLTINDIRSAVSFAGISAGLDSLISRIQTNFPGVPVVCLVPGRYETQTNDNALVDVRYYFQQLALAHTDVYLCCMPQVWAVESGYEADALHYNQTMCTGLGGQLARWVNTNSSLSKWTRSIVSSFFTQPSASVVTAIDTAVDSLVSDGSYFEMDQWLPMLDNGDTRDKQLDWTFKGFGANRTADVSNDTYVITDGISTRYDSTWAPSIYTRKSNVSDVGVLIHILTSSTADNTTVLGSISTGPRVFILSQTTSTSYRVNDGTVSLGTESDFASGNWYGMDRDGTTKRLLKNKTVNATVVVANTGLVVDRTVKVGCVDNLGTLQQFFSGQFRGLVFYKKTTFNKDLYQDVMDALIAAW